MTETSSGAPTRFADGARSPHLARRRRKQKLLQAFGVAGLGVATLMLSILIGSLVVSGYKAFTQTHVTLDVFIDPQEVTAERLPRGGFDDVLARSLAEQLADLDASDRATLRQATSILSNGAQFQLRDAVVADPALIGTSVTITVPASDPFDQLNKGLVDRDTPEGQRRVSDVQIAWFDQLAAQGAVSKPFNWALFFNADSRFPEQAGLWGAIVGSFWALLTCFVISFPLGIGAAIYLEEFAPKSRLSDFIEVNINNLAAVPSVVFGLLALAVFIGWFGMPRSAPVVGGLTLALMTMPTIIIATRAALKAVPPSIREAALGVGASRQQVVFDHVLPLAMPGILTGTIIGLAQALGETAPLLLIGMNAFITSAASTPFDSATALPTQIFIWADSPERGFVSRTSAAILVLLGFLVLMNGLAIFLRSRLERRW
ncbi:phosphate ABC transporter membrane protein 2, PhoT family [Albimonas donghaensis]|uniref:Phosphate transport system permease protein PstA n=1 Tax=Albimonas donghaensis TaxID=356660 RepID=A0A1H2QEC0_9RHOB|nr:phosphate ABC transporter permease PstA [Albimonas donghaensis]SDW05148.1 phosphate ABC transporter membrane protein 2, PhoT family [Albimonas donghaensis]